MLTDEQIKQLEAPLDGDVVSSRMQGGRSVSYVEGHYCIRRANTIFGFGNWSRHTLSNFPVSVEEDIEEVKDNKPTGRVGWRVAYLAHVEFAVRVGEGQGEEAWVRCDGHGFGEGTSYISPGQAHESASKEAETDAMKRAMILWGDQFGLALYDREQVHVDGGTPAPRRASPPPAAEGAPACPKCGGEMRKRNGRNGEFWGCTGYPNCKGTLNIGEEPTPDPLPQEQGEPDPFGDAPGVGSVAPLEQDREPVVVDSPSLSSALWHLGVTGEDAARRLVRAAAEKLWGQMPADTRTLSASHWKELFEQVKADLAAEAREDA